MVDATKAAVTFQGSATQTAGAAYTNPSGTDLTAALGCLITAEITNGGTGPTVGCDFVVEVSNDNSDFMEFARATAGLTAGTTYTFQVELPISVMYARVLFGGNTGQDVTVEADGHKISAVE